MPYAEPRAECERLRDAFAARYDKTDPKAVATLLRDWERMVTFYSFPREHWRHLRTTNIVESPFSSRRGGTAHGCLPPLQARRGRQGRHLEDAARRRTDLEEAQRPGTPPPGRFRGNLHRWREGRGQTGTQSTNSATRGHRRLKPIYTPIDGGSRPDIKGIGLSDWVEYARRLADSPGYVNTFYHQEPRLDIMNADGWPADGLDFIVSSDVFEHVPPPPLLAFANAKRLLKPGGVLILTVP